MTELSEQICRFLIRLCFSGRDRQLIMNDHDGPGVVPGRYAGEAIRLHDGPTPQQVAYEQQRVEADGLAGRICAAAADAARSQYVLFELLGEFDAINAIRYWTDFKSLAHWLSWSCSMTPGVAREHVQVAKALRGMPTITRLFREGRLSYSKVREVTRVVDIVDEQKLCELALTATASQLARVISGFRSTDGMRMPQQTKRRVSWHERADGMVEFRARLPKDEAAMLIAVDKHGKVLALGRSPRLVSKAHRRTLMIRDKMCRYPGCHSARHLKAHHVVPWIFGGRTDLDNLIMLCQWHHTVVHEGGVTITGEPDRCQFQKPDGQPRQPWVDDENLAASRLPRRRAQRDAAKHDPTKHDAAKHDAARQDRLAAVDSFQHPEVKTIRARWAGEPFDLHASVGAFFTIKLPEPTADLDQQAA
jgi:hypothetical protein